MSRKKKYSSPLQLQLLDGHDGGWQSMGWETPPESQIDPFLPEEQEILLPDGGAVITDGSDVNIVPATPEEAGFDPDMVYF